MPFQFGNKLGGKSQLQFDFEKKCREFLEKEGWDGLVKMARSNDVRVKMWAYDTLLGRGFGKIKENVDVTHRHELIQGPDAIAASITELIASETGVSGSIPGPSAGTA